MHTPTDLYSLSAKPSLDTLSLDLLRQYYDTYLSPYRYTFYLSNGQEVNLAFQKHHLCHLLGIETVAKSRFNSEQKLLQYKGKWGYKNIKKGKIDFTHLKGLSPKKFRSIKDKLIFFYLIPHMLESSQVIIDYMPDPSTSNVQCELLIFEIMHGVTVHVGIETQTDGSYFPRTFLVERNKGTRFIEKQANRIDVKKFVKTEISTGVVLKRIISSKYAQKPSNRYRLHRKRARLSL